MPTGPLPHFQHPSLHLPVESVLNNGSGKIFPAAVPIVTKEPDDSIVPAATEDGLVVITILPDEKGRFGFNVKGGADQKLPIIVSRVGANTPADKYEYLGLIH